MNVVESLTHQTVPDLRPRISRWEIAWHKSALSSRLPSFASLFLSSLLLLSLFCCGLSALAVWGFAFLCIGCWCIQ